MKGTVERYFKMVQAFKTVQLHAQKIGLKSQKKQKTVMSHLKCKIFCRLQMEIPTVQLRHKLTLSTTTKLNIKNFEFTQLTEISTKMPRISLREPLAIHVV